MIWLFPKSYVFERDVFPRLEFELDYHDSILHHVDHYITVTFLDFPTEKI